MIDLRTRKWKYTALTIVIVYLVLTVILPFFVLAFCSFLSYFSFERVVFTLTNYEKVFRHPLVVRSIENSLFVGTVGTTICVLLSVVVSFIIVRTKMTGRAMLEYISMIPTAVPSTAFATAILWAWIGGPLYGTHWILMIALITIYFPYAMRSCLPSLRQIDTDLEDCSRVCGANWLRSMAKITLPLLKTGLVVAWTTVFIGFLRELSAVILLYTYGSEMMSVIMYEMWYEGAYVLAAAMGVVQTIIIFITLVIVEKLAGADVSKMIQ